MDAADRYKINLKFRAIEKPFNLTVKHNSDGEKILRKAAEMINNSFDEYKKRLAGMDNTSYYAMVALLMTRRYIETLEQKDNLESSLELLEKEIAAYLQENNK